VAVHGYDFGSAALTRTAPRSPPVRRRPVCCESTTASAFRGCSVP